MSSGGMRRLESPNAKSTKDGYATVLKIINGFHKSLTEEGLPNFDECEAHQVETFVHC